MSDGSKQKHGAENDLEEPEVNLKLIYSLIALAIVAAISIALFIVLPFYHHQGR